VEAQISFEGIPLKGNRSKMAVKLRAITVLDKRVREVSIHVHLKATATNKLKRMRQGLGQKQELSKPGDQQP
jgi:hypothetical protein